MSAGRDVEAMSPWSLTRPDRPTKGPIIRTDTTAYNGFTTSCDRLESASNHQNIMPQVTGRSRLVSGSSMTENDHTEVFDHVKKEKAWLLSSSLSGPLSRSD